MAITKYKASQDLIASNNRKTVSDEFRRVETSIASLINLIEALNLKDATAIVGAADSAGVGFKTLTFKIPN